MIDEQDVSRQFLAAIRQRNLELDGDPIADGQWHRANAVNKPNGKDDGSYKLTIDGLVPYGQFQNFTDGQDTGWWRGQPSRALTDAERAQQDQREEEARIADEKYRAEEAEKAARRANRWWNWNTNESATVSHPYIKKKAIKPHGLKVDEKGRLLVPMYDLEKQLVNLQFIGKDGRKWFLKGGRSKGCCVVIPGGNPKLFVVAEGFATAATINETLDCNVAVAFSAGNLSAVASAVRKALNNAESPEDGWWRFCTMMAAQQGLRPADQRRRFQNTKLVIAADDDWLTEKKINNNPGIMAALAAARIAAALVAVPIFGQNRVDDDTDFNDLKRKLGSNAVKDAINKAVEPKVLFEQRLLADPHSAFADANVKELAVWKQQDRPYYEKLLAALKQKKVRGRDLDGKVKEVIKKELARAAAANARQRSAGEEVDPEALAQSAATLIASDNVLDEFAKVHAQLYVGEKKNAKLLYLIATSRRFDLKTTMHGAVKGPSAVGKSALMGSVTAFMPPEAIFRFTSLSERALLYLPNGGNLAHKILVMAEAPKDEKQQQMQNLLLRELMSEGVLYHSVVQKIGEQFETITIEVKGPVSFLMSTTKTEVDAENETRMLSLELDDSPKQTKRVMLQVAKREGWNRGAEQIDFTPWHDYQRWLATAERRVYIFYVTDLINLIPAKAVRLRRDSAQLIRAIKAHALLHRAHRKRGEQTGAIMATWDDYKAVRELMADPMSEGAEVKARKTLPATVAAVKDAERQRGEGATANEVAIKLGLDRSATKRRLDHAMKAGYVALLDARHGRSYLYTTTGSRIATDTPLLPTVDQVKQAHKKRLEAARAQSSSRTPAENRAHFAHLRLRR